MLKKLHARQEVLGTNLADCRGFPRQEVSGSSLADCKGFPIGTKYSFYIVHIVVPLPKIGLKNKLVSGT